MPPLGFLPPPLLPGPLSGIRVLLRPDVPAKTGEPKEEIGCQLEQVFVRPDRMLLSYDLYGIRQQRLAQGSTEQEYQPAMGMVIGGLFVLLGIAVIVPTFGAFGLLWTAVAGVMTVFYASNHSAAGACPPMISASSHRPAWRISTPASGSLQSSRTTAF